MSTLMLVETYHDKGRELVRRVRRRDGTLAESRIKVMHERPPARSWPLDARHDAAWLALSSAPARTDTRGKIDVVDVFAGCGGLTLGVAEACRALGLDMEARLAVDVDAEALNIYEANFPEANIDVRSVDELVQPPGADTFSSAERRLRSAYGGVDLLIGGPPCQGHSNLNNHTRWADPKNELYLRMARFCEVLRPRHIIIENVPGVVKDSSRVAQRTWARLEDLGYSVDSGVLDASVLGTSQVRRRSLTLASRVVHPDVALAQAEVAVEPRPLGWAIGDLGVDLDNAPFDTPPSPNAVNRRRINYLFDRNLYNLPNEQRPDCHKLKRHSYVSMYGRLHDDRPAPTITTGFGSMGRGRFVHPHEARLLTPHEAARIQGFPDFFTFGPVNRTLLHKVIGNAVPPKLGYAAGLHLLR